MENVDVDELENEVMQKLHEIFTRHKPKTVDLQSPNDNKPTVNIEEVKTWFPKELQDEIQVGLDGTIRTPNYIPDREKSRERWMGIMKVVKAHNGKWLPDGKNSHWQI